MSTQLDQMESKTSFAEEALRLSGKSEEESRRTGAVDRADEQVESLFAPQYQTVNSPVHKAVWGNMVPVEEFDIPPMEGSHPCDSIMEKSIDIVRRRHENGTSLDENKKVHPELIQELADVGYWGLLVDDQHGGSGAPFLRFARFLTRIGMYNSMVAGLASVHGCIGAVDPLNTFGNEEQKKRFLPGLARGDVLSAFALTEPCAGSDLTALRTRAELVNGQYEVTGEKLFITNVIPGRTIGLVVTIDEKPAVLIAELPKEENEAFKIKTYGLYAVKHAYNNGILFNKFKVPEENLLKPKVGDGLTIAYHGLNLGRIALCAGSAANMRIFLANILPWASFRRTYGQLINTRELVKRRVARMAGLIAGSDALVDWCSQLIDDGYRGELECVVAKIFGSESGKEAAIELFMKTHGGRSFLHGHMFGDNVHEYLAPCIYEGEGEMLGMAFFKSIVKEHGKKFFEPIGKALQRTGIKNFNPGNPAHAFALRKELGSYSKWWLGRRFASRGFPDLSSIRQPLADHVSYAADKFPKFADELSSVMRKHQLKLADRQCRIAEVSQRVQNMVTLLVTALWGNRQKDEISFAAADILCQDIRRQLNGERPSDSYFRDVSRLADSIIDGGYEAIAGISQQEILMRYER